MLVIHHLDHSRSERILWLAEELGLEYSLVQHQRDPQTRRAPPALKAINPLGKAPAIEDGEVKLAESGAIVDYLVQQYGNGRLRPAPGDAAYAPYLHWMYAAEATLMLTPMVDLLATMSGAHSPGLDRFLQGEYAKMLGHLNAVLTAQPHVAGEAFTAADIMVTFPLTMLAKELMPGMKLMPDMADYPALTAYLQRVQARPAWQRALAKMVNG